jgi:hypothetical protein
MLGPVYEPEEDHVRGTARPRRATPITGSHAGFLAGRSPRNQGLRYSADPPKVEEIVAVMRAAGDGARGRRLRGLVVILWRAGLRIQEAPDLTEADLDQRRGSRLLLARRGTASRSTLGGVSLMLRTGRPPSAVDRRGALVQLV